MFIGFLYSYTFWVCKIIQCLTDDLPGLYICVTLIYTFDLTNGRALWQKHNFQFWVLREMYPAAEKKNWPVWTWLELPSPSCVREPPGNQTPRLDKYKNTRSGSSLIGQNDMWFCEWGVLTSAGVLHHQVQGLLRLDHLKEFHCKVTGQKSREGMHEVFQKKCGQLS